MTEHQQYFCQVQLQLQMARGAQFMALAQIQMIAVRHCVFCSVLILCRFLFVVKFFRLRHVTVHTFYL